MKPTGGRKGISKLAIPVALIVILVAAGAVVFLSRGSAASTTQTSTAGSSPSIPVRSAVNQLIQDINSRNVDALTNFYNQSSVVVWFGRTGGLSGQYSGTGNIRLIYATTVGKTTQMDVNFSNYAEKVFSPTHINTTFMLVMLANSSTAGKVNATVNVSQEWKWGSGGWQIFKENWNYTYFDASQIDAGIASGTTFPQWGVMQMGENPNLVSEKSFEWQAGPFLASGVYAFLFGVVFILAVKSRSRSGGARRTRQRKPSTT